MSNSYYQDDRETSIDDHDDDALNKSLFNPLIYNGGVEACSKHDSSREVAAVPPSLPGFSADPGDSAVAFEADGVEPGVEAAPTRSMTLAQAAVQITRDNYRWGSAPLGTAAAPITFGFRTSGPTYTVSGRDLAGTFSAFNAAQEAAARATLAQWASIANITFVDRGRTNDATILFGNYSSSTDGSGAFASYPGNTSSTSLSGDIWYNTNNPSSMRFDPGTYGYSTLLHEIGHAIGLQHPGNYNASGGSQITYNNSAEYIQDTEMYSLMSYFGPSFTGGSFSVECETPMMADIAAVQRLYGANTSTRTEDNVYGFNSNAGSPFTITSSGQHVVFTVYDMGGSDTLNFSGYTQNQTINLNPESFSNVGGDVSNVSIASGVTIERAIGGSGNDTFILNNGTPNTVTGGGGTDIFRASATGWQKAAITDLGLGDAINVTNAVQSSFSYDWSGTSLTLVNGGSVTTTSTLNLSNNPVGHLVLGTDPNGGIDLTLARQNLQLSDFSGDGRSDLLWRNRNGTLIEWDMNERTPIGRGVLGNDPNWTVVGTGDFNGDHSFDILQRNAVTGQVLATNMDGRTVLSSRIIGGDANWSIAGTGDFNGDGKSDLLWRHTNGTLVEWLMNDRTTIASAVIGNDPNWTVVGTSDFNGDGMTDILQRNSITGQVLETEMNGLTSLSVGLIGGDRDWSIAGTGDFNGDGKSDLLWRHTNGTLLEWEMNGRTTTGRGVIGGDPNWKVVGTGDFNNDGMSDILQRNSTTGQVLESLMNGRTTLSAGLIGGDLEWSVVSGQSVYL